MYILTLGVLAPSRGRGVGSRRLEQCLKVVGESLPEVGEAYLHVQVRPVPAASAGSRQEEEIVCARAVLWGALEPAALGNSALNRLDRADRRAPRAPTD